MRKAILRRHTFLPLTALCIEETKMLENNVDFPKEQEETNVEIGMADQVNP